MPDLLISGPAGAGKTAAARRELEESSELTVAADFQSIYAALTLASRDEYGRYPLGDPSLLPLTEYVRRAVITGARCGTSGWSRPTATATPAAAGSSWTGGGRAPSSGS